MAENLKMIRVKSKLDELFKDKIDISDAKSEEDKLNKFYTRAIAALSIAMHGVVGYDVAAKSVTDGYHDLGIDAVYNDSVQKKLWVVQSKWRKTGTGSVSQEEAGAFAEGLKRIINLDLDGANKKIKAKQQDIEAALRDMDYQIEMVYCHTGNQAMTTYPFRPIQELLSQVNEDDSMDLLIYTEDKLQEIYEFLANGQNCDNIVLEDVLLSNWGIVESPLKAYYGTIPASAVGEWFSRYGNRLFAKNIRFYKGSTDVNTGIKEVLKNEPENFFYYNNGIKILCNKITKKAAYSTSRDIGLFSLEGVSLVNGAQTTGVIGALYLETPNIISEAKVFIQIIDLGDAEEEQSTQITKLSNTQNKIESKDFASLDPNQERLRMELSLGGIQYLYKAGAKIDDPSRQISLDEAIISQACLLDDLSIVATTKRNVGALTENIEKAPYKQLFNNSTNSFSFYNGVQVLRAVDKYINTNEVSSTGRKRLVLIHGNRLLLHLILGKIKEISGFNEMYKTGNEIDVAVKSLFGEYWNKVYDAMEKSFPDAYPAHVFKNVGRIKELITNNNLLTMK